MYIYLHTSFFFIIFGRLGLLKISKDDVHRYVNNKKNPCLFREIKKLIECKIACI